MATSASAAPPVPNVGESLYDCKLCGGSEIRFADMAKSRSKKDGRQYTWGVCLACDRKRKRRWERMRASIPRGENGRVVEAVAPASDPWPARMLGELLRDDRDRGHFDFTDVWEENVKFVLRRVRPPERKAWRAAFEETRAGWQAAFDRVPGPGFTLSEELTDEPVDSLSGELVPVLLDVA
jgi:hypothetical protein